MASIVSFIGTINAALLSQGLEEVSESDGSNEFRVLASNWPGIVEAELEDGAYYFTRQEAVLTNRVPGAWGYADGYMLPDDALHVRRVWTGGEGRRRDEASWTQDGSAVFANAPDGLRVELVVSPEPHLWSANFARGVQMKLEAVILRAIKEEHNEAVAMEQAAEMHFQRARTSSSKARSPAPLLRRGRIWEARFRG